MAQFNETFQYNTSIIAVLKSLLKYALLTIKIESVCNFTKLVAPLSYKLLEEVSHGLSSSTQLHPCHYNSRMRHPKQAALTSLTEN